MATASDPEGDYVAREQAGKIEHIHATSVHVLDKLVGGLRQNQPRHRCYDLRVKAPEHGVIAGRFPQRHCLSNI